MRIFASVVCIGFVGCAMPPHTAHDACTGVVTAVLQRAASCDLTSDEVVATQQNAMLGSCCDALDGCAQPLTEVPSAKAWSACLESIETLACDATRSMNLPPLPKACAGIVPVDGGAPTFHGQADSAEPG